MDHNDWKLQNRFPIKYWLSKLNKDQLNLLVEVKNRFNWQIDDFTQEKREELQNKIDVHITNRAKRELLERHHAEIINRSDFLVTYRKILDPETNLINEELFNEFVMCFEVVGISSPWVFEENEIKALDYLQDVATLNLIEFLRNQIINIDTYGDPRHKEVPEWQRILDKLANQFDYKYNTVKFTIIFYFMEEKKLFPKGFTQLYYMDFVREKYLKGNGFNKLDFSSMSDEKPIKMNPHKERLNNILKG